MTMMRTVFGTLLALVAFAMATFFLGLVLALTYGLVIAAVAMIVSLAEPRTTKPAGKGPQTTERTVLATLWTVIAVWAVIDRLGPHDMAGPMFSMIFTVIIVATAAILNIALKREPFTTVTGAGDAR